MSSDGRGLESLTIVVPAFNEEQALAETLNGLLVVAADNHWEIIVVDDGSTDGSEQILNQFRDRVRVVRNRYNRGYGASIKTGCQISQAAFVAIFDADGQHRPNDLLKLWQHARDYDMLVGKRSADSDVQTMRVPGKWFLTKVCTFISGHPIPDLNSGLRIYRRTFLEKVLHLMPDGFSFTTTSTLAALKLGFSVEYVSIRVKSRKGKSKVRPARDGLILLMLILRLFVLFSPLRIFVPVATGLGLVGLSYEIYVIVTVRLMVANGALLLVLTSIMIFFFGLLVDQVSAMRRERYL